MIKKCPKCGEYTMKDMHCTKTRKAEPAKMLTKYSKYRIK